MSDPYQLPEPPRPQAPGSSLSTKQWLATLGAAITIAVLASVLTAVLVSRGGSSNGAQPVALLAGSSSASDRDASGGVDATTAVNGATPTGAGEVIVNSGKAGSTPTKSVTVTASTPTSHASSATSSHTSGGSSGVSTPHTSFIRPSNILSLVSGIHIGPIDTNLDYQASANYGEANLSAGFSPDPYSVGMTTGGQTNTSYLGSSCSGFATIHPDLQVNFGGGGSSRLRIYFVASSGDPAIVVNDPYGNFYCVNNSFGTVDPTIDFNNPAGGSYDVWVASPAGNTTVSGTLYLTENSGNHP